MTARERRDGVRLGALLCTAWLLASGIALPQDKSVPDVRRQQQELEKIKREVSQSQKRIDSLKREESRLNAELSGYDEKIASQRRSLNSTAADLSKVSRLINEAEKQRDGGREELERRQRRLLGNIRQLYLSSRSARAGFASGALEERSLNRRLVYLATVAGYESQQVAAVDQTITGITQEIAKLQSREVRLSAQKEERAAAYTLETSRKQKRQQALDRLRRTAKEESDRIVTLQKAAAEMEALVARLEKSREQKPAKRRQSESSAFTALKGLLDPPCRGTVVEKFGPATHPVTKLKSYSPGITIQGASSGAVVAVASGEVVYTGTLRGYGNFVIVNHGGDYFATYALLGQISVTTGHTVVEGTTLGRSGSDGLVRFELRNGREAVNPMEWLRRDAF